MGQNMVLKIIAAIIAGSGAFWCLVPSMSVNIAAHSGKDEPWHAAAIYIVSVVIAAICMIVRPIALRHKASDVAKCCLILAILALSFNVKNAYNSSTISRAKFGDPLRGENEQIARLENEEKMLADFIAKSSPRASAVVEAEIAMKLLDPQAEGCVGTAWNGPVTKKVCPVVVQLRAEKAAAEAYEAKEARLIQVREQRKDMKKNSVTDPTVENIGALLGLAMTVTSTTQKAIGMGDDLHVAIFVESLATFGPGIFYFAFMAFLSWLGQRPVMKPEEKLDPAPLSENPERAPAAPKAKKGKPAVELPPCIEAFFATSVVERRGGKIGATDFYAAYAASTPSPLSANMFGRAATATYRKSEGRTNQYLGIAIKAAPVLKVVRG